MNKGKKPMKKQEDHRALPEMTDEAAARHRASYIKQGLITPGEPKKYMSPEEIKAYREKLIANGTLKPGAGLHRIKPPRPPRDFNSPRPFRKSTIVQ